MHIMLDVALETLQGSQYNRLDNPIKDIWLNSTIDDFVKDVVDGANQPNPTKRIPTGVVTYQDIISKYNDLRTLIAIADLRVGSNTDTLSLVSVIGNGTNITIITNNYHDLQIGDMINVSGLSGMSGLSGNGKFAVTTILDNYTFTYTATSTGTANIASAVISYEYPRNYMAFPLPNNLYRFETSSSLVRPIGCTKSYKIIPNVVPTTYDISVFNDDPFGGGAKYMATSIINNSLRVWNLNRYDILNVSITYIKRPAKLSDTVLQCDLPEIVHTKIVELAARKIAAYNSNENYQAVANEIKTTE